MGSLGYRFSSTCLLLVSSLLRASDVPPAQAKLPCDLLTHVELTKIKGTSTCSVLQRGFALARSSRLEEAGKQFHLALESAKAAGNLWLEGKAHRGLGGVLISDSKYAAAREELQLAREQLEKAGDAAGVADADHQLAREAYFSSDRKHSLELYDKAIAEFKALGDEHSVLAVDLNKDFLLPTDANRVKRVEDYVTRAREMHDQHLLCRALQEEGDVHYSTGDYGASLSAYSESLKIAERDADKRVLAGLLISMGRLLRAQGRPEAALPYYRRALNIDRRLHDQPAEIQALNASAIAYHNLNQDDRALAFYRRALALAQSIHSPRFEHFQLGNLAGAYEQAGNCRKAIPLLEKVIAEEERTVTRAYRYRSLADCQYRLGDYQTAHESVNHALELFANDNTQEAQLDALTTRALIRSKLGDEAGASSDLDRMTVILEERRTKLTPSDYLKRGLIDYESEYYDAEIFVAFQNGNYARALEVEEKARARAFLDLLATRSSAPGSASQNVSPEKQDVSRLEPDSTVAAEAFTYAQILEAARHLNSTVLSYWMMDESWNNGGELFILLVSPQGEVRGTRIRVSRSRLEKLVAETRTSAAIETPSTTRERKADVWSKLYQLLIIPIKAQLPSKPGALLTIVPHGPLFELSFAGLRDADSRYLLERYAIHYLPSASVLRYTNKNHEDSAARPQKRVLLAQTFEQAGSGVSRLNYARAELKAISAALGPDASIADSYGSLETIETELRDATMVHFTTHAVYDDKSPLDSYLMVGANPKADRLTAQQIYGLRIPADLVVLSACQTARGKVTGDGVNGITRAFLAAGAASVVASVWDVADAPTQQLMTGFYRALQQGKSKNQALREAQLALLRKLRAGKVTTTNRLGTFVLRENPQLWAGFLLEGNP